MVAYRFGFFAILLVLTACSQQGAGPAQGVDPPKPSGEGDGGPSLQAVYSPGAGTWSPVAFAWIDPLQGATRLADLDDEDDEYTTVSLPFSFPWGGKAVTEIAVSTNGVIADGPEGTSAYSNSSLPSGGQNRFAPVFWDDLYNDCPQGGIYTRTLTSGGNPSAFVVGWVKVRHYGGTCSGQGTVSFQAVLYPDGRVLYQFLDTDFGNRRWNAGASATVGLQGAPEGYPQAYALWSHNSPVVPNGTAILYTPPPAAQALSAGTLTPLCRLPDAQEGSPYGPVHLYGPSDLASLPSGMTKTSFRGGVKVDGAPGAGTAGTYVLAEPRALTGGCFLKVRPGAMD
ncbi:hypothetical protein FJNA_15270 [Thermus sp. FJN-A]